MTFLAAALWWISGATGLLSIGSFLHWKDRNPDKAKAAKVTVFAGVVSLIVGYLGSLAG